MAARMNNAYACVRYVPRSWRGNDAGIPLVPSTRSMLQMSHAIWGYRIRYGFLSLDKGTTVTMYRTCCANRLC